MLKQQSVLTFWEMQSTACSVIQTTFPQFLTLSQRQLHIEINPGYTPGIWVVFSGLGVEMWRCYLLWNLACIWLRPWKCFCKSCASKNGWNELASQECWFARHSDMLPRKASFVFKGCRLTQIRIYSKPSNTSCQLLT